MSVTDDHRRALRWLQTADQDMEAAGLLKSSGMHAHACFTAQQCAGKAVKAAWYCLGEEPWGHSIQALVRDYPGRAAAPDWLSWITDAAVLDRFYIPTRYPDGLPDLTPGEAYFEQDAERAIGLAGRFLEATHRWIDHQSLQGPAPPGR